MSPVRKERSHGDSPPRRCALSASNQGGRLRPPFFLAKLLKVSEAVPFTLGY
jgi:hypothetical protein